MKSIFPGLSAIVILLVLSGSTSHGFVSSYVEDFTTAVYEDTANTSADWDSSLRCTRPTGTDARRWAWSSRGENRHMGWA